MSAYLKELNKQQYAAVTGNSPFIEILAGPGTGKTKTLVARISYLLEQRVKPQNILALTFTKKSAVEISKRLLTKKVFTGTFHQLALSILSEAGRQAKIIPEQKRVQLLKKLRKDKALPAGIRALSVRELGLIISRAKSVSESPVNYRMLLELYQRLLARECLSDFDDLLLDASKILEVNSKLTAKFKKRYTNILVDEFQDTNEIQYRILKQLAAGSIFIIGDPFQAIYSFRGSNSSVFAKFEKDFNPKKIVLTTNYRSGKKIIEAAYSLFPESSVPDSENKTETTVELLQTLNEFTEADFILKQIASNLGGFDLNQAGELNLHTTEKDDFSDFAVVYRTHGMSRILQQRFKDSGVPYQVVGARGFLSDKNLNFLCLLCSYLDSGSEAQLNDLLHSKIVGLTQREDELVSLIKKDLHAGLETMYLQKQLKSKRLGRLLEFLNTVGGNPEEIINEAISVFELETAVADLNRHNNAFNEFEMLVSRFETLEEFGEYLDELSENGYYDEYSNKVTLLTMHAAKGLEFKNVYVCGFEDGIIPFTKFNRSDEELEEEKRLLYVAMTRAKNSLYLITAKERMHSKTQISRFWELIKKVGVILNEDEVSKKIEKKRFFAKQKKSQLGMFA